MQLLYLRHLLVVVEYEHWADRQAREQLAEEPSREAGHVVEVFRRQRGKG